MSGDREITQPSKSEKLAPDITEARSYADSYLESFKNTPPVRPPASPKQIEVTDLDSFREVTAYKLAYRAYKTDAYCRRFSEVVESDLVPEQDKDRVRLFALREIADPLNRSYRLEAEDHDRFLDETHRVYPLIDYDESKRLARQELEELQADDAHIRLAQQTIEKLYEDRTHALSSKIFKGLPDFGLTIDSTPIDRKAGTPEEGESYFQPTIRSEVVSQLLNEAAGEVKQRADEAIADADRQARELMNQGRLAKFKAGLAIGRFRLQEQKLLRVLQDLNDLFRRSSNRK